MQRQIQDLLELFAKIFKGNNPVNTFAKFSPSGVLKFSEKHLMILNALHISG